MISRLRSLVASVRTVARNWGTIRSLAAEVESCPICEADAFSPSVVCIEHTRTLVSALSDMSGAGEDVVLNTMLDDDDLIVAPHARALGELLDAEDEEGER